MEEGPVPDPPFGIGRRLVESRPQRAAQITASTLWNLGDGRKLTTAEFLRERGRDLPNNFRASLARASFEHLLEDSVLGKMIEPEGFRRLEPPGDRPARRLKPGALPQEVRAVVQCLLLLQGLESPEQYRVHRANLRRMREALERHRPLPGYRPPAPIPDTIEEWLEGPPKDPEEVVLDALDADLEGFAKLAESIEELIKAAGFRLDWETGFVEVPSGPEGGRPRRFLRELVKALVEYRLKNHMGAGRSGEVREWLAAELAPYFPADLLDTRKDAVLDRALKRALE